MTGIVNELYPEGGISHTLEGLYLSHDLRAQPASPAYVYANFVASLDGRIAVPRDNGSDLRVPKQTANDRDWRLYQELAAQADLIISSGRYLRDWAEGKAQEILQVDDPRYADLRRWRRERGLTPQPDIAIISGSLRFPIPDVLTAGGRKVVVFTTAGPDPERVAEIERKAGQVIVAGNEETVLGERMAQEMARLGYQTVYSAAGPRILHLLVTGGVLNRLYLTEVPRLLGADKFATILEGEMLKPALDMRLHALYHDPHALDGLGQLLLSYDSIP